MACKNRQGSYGGYNPGEPRLNGGFAEYIHLHPNSILHPIAPDVPPEIAVMYNPLGAGVRWAVHLYHDRPETFLRVMRNGMKADWSWDRAAAEYQKVQDRIDALRAAQINRPHPATPSKP